MDLRNVPGITRALLITITLLFLGLFLLVPLIFIFAQALADGYRVFVHAIANREALSAIGLTVTIAAVSVPLNLIFGVAAAWAITKFNFKGKNLLITLIDLPLAVSPVITGLLFVLLFGAHGWFGPWLDYHDINVIFAIPGIVLATVFVTFPYIAREVIPVMQVQGSVEEEAALSLGAKGWQVLWHVTLPKIRWGLLYGVVLCTARAMGEFGAVSVVSGHIQGKTNTMPLHVEILYNEYNFAAAFAVASLLAVLALVTVAVKSMAEWKAQQSVAHSVHSGSFQEVTADGH